MLHTVKASFYEDVPYKYQWNLIESEIFSFTSRLWLMEAPGGLASVQAPGRQILKRRLLAVFLATRLLKIPALGRTGSTFGKPCIYILTLQASLKCIVDQDGVTSEDNAKDTAFYQWVTFMMAAQVRTIGSNDITFSSRQPSSICHSRYGVLWKVDSLLHLEQMPRPRWSSVLMHAMTMVW